MTRALIIDDNADNVAILAEMLSIEGVEHIAIMNPLQLNNVVDDDHKFEVIFLDLEMPGIDGYKLHEQLRDDERFADVPVVAYTVHVSEINAARRFGFHSFIGKPLDADLFPDQLARILNGERVWSLP